MPVADEVYRLQTGSDAECLAFRRIADAGHYRRDGGTRQGIYVATPGGALLGSINSNDPQRVRALIESSWAKWQAMSAEERRVVESERFDPEGRWEDAYPEDGLALEIVKRDLPADGEPTGERSTGWNRDYAWFTKEEVESLLPGGGEGAPLDRTVPRALLERLVALHFVDNVWGQTLPFAAEEIVSAEARVVHTRARALHLSYTIEGESEVRASGEWQMGDNIWKPRKEWPRSMKCRFRGTFTYSGMAGRITEFEMLVAAQPTGFTAANGRRRHGDTEAIGMVVRLAPPGRRTPPAFADLYGTEWMLATGCHLAPPE